MKKPKLILHIGSPKSGSTTIQKSLIKNAGFLKEKGVFSGNYSLVTVGLKLRNSGYHFSKTDMRQESYLPVEAAFVSYMNQFLDSGCDTVIISDEGFFYHYAEKECRENLCKDIKSIFSYFDVKIVCYLRRQDLFFESLYSQNIRYYDAGRDARKKPVKSSGWFAEDKPLSHFQRFVNENLHSTDYAERMSVWAEAFGKENVIIRPFEKSQLKNGLIYDFYSNALNFSDEDISKLESVMDYNESQCRDILEFRMASGIDDHFIFEHVNSLSDNKNKNLRFFTNDERKRFLSFHEEGNAFLAREYLGREDGRLFYDEIEDYEPYPGLTLEKSKEIGKKVLAVINFNNKNALDLPNLNEYTSVEGVINEAKSTFFNNVDKRYVERKLGRLFNILNGSEKTVVIYGGRGWLASWIFEISNPYNKCLKVYVADKAFEGKRRHKGCLVVSFDQLEALTPDIIIIAAKYSGKAIRKDLSKLKLPNTVICPAYDFSDEAWEAVLPSFLTKPYIVIC